MKKLIALLALGCALLAGCNTMAGMGKDIQTGGQKLENAADNTKQTPPFAAFSLFGPRYSSSSGVNGASIWIHVRRPRPTSGS